MCALELKDDTSLAKESSKPLIRHDIFLPHMDEGIINKVT
jgi:hypothetical protein